MRVSARADYALRAVAELALVADDARLKRDVIATRQTIPVEFLGSVLLTLKHVGIVQSQRGAGGGFRLARLAGAPSMANRNRCRGHGGAAGQWPTAPHLVPEDGHANSARNSSRRW